jgi:hypothetical protein
MGHNRHTSRDGEEDAKSRGRCRYVSVIQVIQSIACPYALGQEVTLCGYLGSVVGMIRF